MKITVQTGLLFKHAMEFVDRREEYKTLDELNKAFGDLVAKHGVETFSCAELSSPRMDKPVGLIFGRPNDGFLRDYIQTQSFRRDPMVREAFMTTKPFGWNEVLDRGELTPEAAAVMALARDWSKNAGFVVPIHKPGEPIVTVVMTGKHLDANPALRPYLHLIAIYFHEAGRKLAAADVDAKTADRILNDLEVECLRAAAVGRSDWEIGQITNLRETEVRAILDDARKRLNAPTRMQAIFSAIQRKELAL